MFYGLSIAHPRSRAKRKSAFFSEAPQGGQSFLWKLDILSDVCYN